LCLLFIIFLYALKKVMDTEGYPEGDFTFVTDNLQRYMLEDAYKSLKEKDLWDFVKNEYDERKALEQPEILDIFLGMKYKTHTINTFAIVMRNMKKIACDGWDEYVKEWISTKID
jgi:hypothetical protein